MRALVLVAVLVCACSGVQGDIKRAAFRESMADIWKGKDRGLWSYNVTILESTSDSRDALGHYQYVPPAHVSQFQVQRCVRALGGTEIKNAEYLAGATNLLFRVLRQDPTGALRASACYQLGRILLRQELEPGDFQPPAVGAGDRIHAVAYDLSSLRQKINEGERVAESEVVFLMRTLAKERPPRFNSAAEMVRVLVVSPVAGSAPGAVTKTLELIAPRIVRTCIVVALRDVACGNPDTGALHDPSDLVRADAIDVLTRVRLPFARRAAAARLWDPLDPAERESHVRTALLRYLGEVGGPIAFEAALRRFDDIDSGVRYHAHRALQRMTGADVPPEYSDWVIWRRWHPEWQYVESRAAGE